MQLHFKRQRVSPKLLWTAGVALALIVAALVALAVMDTGIKRDQYQIMKLTTGEIFFGKLQNVKGDYVVVENAYFIQDGQEPNETTILSRKNTIAKSESPLRIKSDKIVYWENLAKDSKVAELIKNSTGN
jgi:hypothetical protein